MTLYADVDGLRVSDGTEADIKLDNPRYPVEGAKAYFSGGAGLSSTASDYARFVQMLLNEGELDNQRLLGRKSVELMRAARIDWDDDGLADLASDSRLLVTLAWQAKLVQRGLFLGWRLQHVVLDRSERGPYRRLHVASPANNIRHNVPLPDAGLPGSRINARN